MSHPKEISKVIDDFLPNRRIDEIKPHQIGHINPTYIVRHHDDSAQGVLFLQRLNTHVFQHPQSVIRNIERITNHLQKKILASGRKDAHRKTLQLVRAADGRAFNIDDSGQFWRAYRYIEDSYSISTVETTQQANAAARAFGEFIHLLADLPPPPLLVTIDSFHNTRWRFEEFLNISEKDPLGRLAEARDEIEFAILRESTIETFIELQSSGALPLRPVHNDTKINNILFDSKSDEALCVVDLDTVMPGLVAHDFGDLVRSSIGDHTEDEADLGKIHLRMPIFSALAKGYLDGTQGLLTATEVRSLTAGVGVITLELGLRFLTDYLQGDIYFKPKWPSQNLQRARVQFRLLELIEQHAGELRAIVEESRGKVLHSKK